MNYDALPGGCAVGVALESNVGHAEACLLEAEVYLRPDADVERLLDGSAGLHARSSRRPRGRTRRSS
jgi:hypothetical protein